MLVGATTGSLCDRQQVYKRNKRHRTYVTDTHCRPRITDISNGMVPARPLPAIDKALRITARTGP